MNFAPAMLSGHFEALGQLARGVETHVEARDQYRVIFKDLPTYITPKLYMFKLLKFEKVIYAQHI